MYYILAFIIALILLWFVMNSAHKKEGEKIGGCAMAVQDSSENWTVTSNWTVQRIGQLQVTGLKRKKHYIYK